MTDDPILQVDSSDPSHSFACHFPVGTDGSSGTLATTTSTPIPSPGIKVDGRPPRLTGDTPSEDLGSNDPQTKGSED